MCIRMCSTCINFRNLHCHTHKPQVSIWGVNKDLYFILDKLINYSLMCHRYDSRVKAMELDEKHTEQYSDIGGLDKQIEDVS